jgi:6-phosphogluconolactonase
MSVHRHAYPTAAEAAAACAEHTAALLEETLSGSPAATLAISGGRTPALLFPHLAAAKLAWERLHVFWVDERGVPPSHPESNYALAEKHFLREVEIPMRNIHRIQTELGAQEAARKYVDDIVRHFDLERGQLPHFDVMLRGVGPDGHTASLFPGDPLINDTEGIAAAVYVEKLDQWRVTLLPGVLQAARHTALLVTGADKAEMLRDVLCGQFDPLRYPAQMMAHNARFVHWFLDAAAASLLD